MINSSVPSRTQSSRHDSRVLKDIIMMQIANNRSPDDAVNILVNFLIESNKFVDEKKLKSEILTAVEKKDSNGLSLIIQTVVGERKSGDDFWNKMDSQFYDILHEAKQGFKINTAINVILVVIGIVLISNSIAYTWIRGSADSWSIFSGGIGIGALVSLFFYKSQDAVTKAVANLSAVDMVFKSHYRAYESITDYDYKADNSIQIREIEDLADMLRLLEDTTKKHVHLIDRLQLIETNKQDRRDQSKLSTSTVDPVRPADNAIEKNIHGTKNEEPS